MSDLRIALFTDTFHEVNGAAHTCRHLRQFAERRGLPLLAVHSGVETRRFEQRSVTTLELKRSHATIPVDVDFGFDALLWRNWSRIQEEMEAFRPDLVHIISPGDFSVLGACSARKLGIPIIGSYHTNLHQFAAARLKESLHFVPPHPRQSICSFVETMLGRGLLKFYEIPQMILAPNQELQTWLEHGSHRPCRIMRRGVDTELFNPRHRNTHDGIFRLGYVGRLVREKNLRLLAELERALAGAGLTNYRFVMVGNGDERPWLEKNLRQAEFTGVLRGMDLARAYANMDLFVFPSRADAYGNVVQEALASGTPVLASHEGGPRHLVESDVTGYVAESENDFIERAVAAVAEPEAVQQMRTAARMAACAASWDRVFETVWESYETCLRHSRHRAGVVLGPPIENQSARHAALCNVGGVEAKSAQQLQT